jgi:hypothetical protein
VSRDDTPPPGDDAVIDFVLSSPDGNEYVLVLVEDRPWTQPGVIDHLTDRVNRCVSYVRDGLLARDFPETVGRTIRVDVRYAEPPDPDVEALFLRFEAALSQRGLDFSAEELGPEEPDERDEPGEPEGPGGGATGAPDPGTSP